jgi:DNA-binding transcriptional LysR family regulator
MWEAIELREIRIFLTLAEERHFGRSAERLGLTTSRVSQSLRELEAKLGGQLLHRTTRSVALTPLGKRFRDRTAPAYLQLTDAIAQTHAANLQPAGTVRVGLLSAPAGGSQLLPICRAFERRHRASHAEVHEVPLSDPFGLLRRGELDLIATWLPHGQSDLANGPTLAREPRVLAVAPDHPLARRSDVSIEDVADYQVAPLMESVFPSELAEVLVPHKTPSGRPIRRLRSQIGERARADRGRANTELSYLVARGEVVHPTVAAVAEYWGHPEIVYVPIADMRPVRSALVWPRRAANPRAREFIAVARDVLRAERQPAARGRRRRGARVREQSGRAAAMGADEMHI